MQHDDMLIAVGGKLVRARIAVTGFAYLPLQPLFLLCQAFPRPSCQKPATPATWLIIKWLTCNKTSNTPATSATSHTSLTRYFNFTPNTFAILARTPTVALCSPLSSLPT